MRYEVRFTNQFKKDLKLAKKQHKNIDKLFAVVEKLANGEALDPKLRDHDLTGKYEGCRECHVPVLHAVFGNLVLIQRVVFPCAVCAYLT